MSQGHDEDVNAMSGNEFPKLVLGKLDQNAEVTPTAYYDPDGDYIDFVATPESYYAERIDNLVTVYYSQESNEIIGAAIKGVKKFIERHPTMMVEIEDGRINVGVLLTARLHLPGEVADDKVLIRKYKKIRDIAIRTNAVAELDLSETTR